MTAEKHVHVPMDDKDYRKQVCACGAYRFADTDKHTREWWGWKPWCETGPTCNQGRGLQMAEFKSAFFQSANRTAVFDHSKKAIAIFDGDLSNFQFMLSEYRRTDSTSCSRFSDHTFGFGYRIDEPAVKFVVDMALGRDSSGDALANCALSLLKDLGVDIFGSDQLRATFLLKEAYAALSHAVVGLGDKAMISINAISAGIDRASKERAMMKPAEVLASKLVDAYREITIQGTPEILHLRVLQSTTSCGMRSKAEVFARTGTGASDSRLRTLRLAFITRQPDKGFWSLTTSIKYDHRPIATTTLEILQQTARLLCQMLTGRFDSNVDPRAISRVVSALYVAESMESQEDVDRCLEALRLSLRPLDLCGGCGQETTACTSVYKACFRRNSKTYEEASGSSRIMCTKEFRLRPYKSPVMLAVDDQSEPP